MKLVQRAIRRPPLASRPHRRPRGWLRHYTAQLGPRAADASHLAFERNAAQRLERMRQAAADQLRERLRPTRPTMRTLRVAPGARLHWSSVPVPPPPGPDGAIVRPLAVATCDMDPVIALGSGPFVLPLHIGHECVAEVVAVGDEVSGVTIGERVIVPFQISCGECVSCRQGRTGNCATVPPMSMYGFGLAGGHWGGAISDQLAVPFADAMLVPLPAGIDPAAAASVADTVSDGFRHIAPFLPDLLAAGQDAEVIIVAAVNRRSPFSASCALYAGLVAQALDAKRVYLADRRDHVRDAAERLGLVALDPRELSGVPQAPLVADISGSAKGLATALSKVAPDGFCSSAGNLHRRARIPALSLYARNVTCRISRTHVRTLIPQVLALMRDGLEPARVTTVTASFDEAPAALREHYLGNGIKTILTQDG